MFPQPFEVELVGSEWWEVLTPLIGPLVIALGALGAAWLTVRTANIRHHEQLEHDRELHREQLEHDRDLHAAQLRHDRTLRHREHVRQVLDAVIENVQRLVRGIDHLDDAIAEAEGRRKELEIDEEQSAPSERGPIERERAELEIDLHGRMAEMHSELAEAWVDSLRLRVRLGGERIVLSHEDLLDAVGTWMEIVGRDQPPAKRLPGNIEEGQEAMKTINQTQAAFFLACEVWERTHTSEVASGV